jgi:alpha-1,3-rhamnosyl/mannosyltransferase
MPVLDAMARGVPVLTSNVSAMPEVSGGAALLVDPTDVQSIADGLCQLATNSDLRGALIRAGLARAKEFTWEKSVDATWEVYEELMAKS